MSEREKATQKGKEGTSLCTLLVHLQRPWAQPIALSDEHRSNFPETSLPDIQVCRKGENKKAVCAKTLSPAKNITGKDTGTLSTGCVETTSPHLHFSFTKFNPKVLVRSGADSIFPPVSLPHVHVRDL